METHRHGTAPPPAGPYRHRRSYAKPVPGVVAISALAFGLMWTSPGQGQTACGKRADILKHLDGSYQEHPVVVGLGDDGALYEVLATDDGATWSLLYSMPSGMSCLMATGKDWQAAPPKVEGGPEL